tara:strand:- start:754 stop:1200 length:447 start_codon:yes stop_codon:yes gene_type:complete
MKLLGCLALFICSTVAHGQVRTSKIPSEVTTDTKWDVAKTLIERHSLRKRLEREVYEFHPEKAVHVTHTQYQIEDDLSVWIEHDFDNRIRSLKIAIAVVPQDGHPDRLALSITSLMLHPDGKIGFRVLPGKIKPTPTRLPGFPSSSTD